MERYTLKDLESVTGIKSDTIRIWEKRYGILTPHLTSGKRRFYNDADLIRLINVSILNRHGTRISKIASMTGLSPSFSKSKLARAHARLKGMLAPAEAPHAS